MRVSRAEVAGNYVIMALFAFFALWPLATIVVTALGPASVGETGAFHPANFVRAWQEGQFSHFLSNSVAVTVTTVAIASILSLLAGYAFGTMRFRGDGIVFALFLLGLMVPTEALIVPLYFDLRTFGLTDTLWGVALPQVAQSTAFGTYWMRTYFRQSPRAIIDAAKLDGAGPWRILWQVLVPGAVPAITTMVVLTTMWTWNEFLIPLALSPTGAWRTAPNALARFSGQYTEGTALLAAGAILVALPIAVLYLVLQRHFIRGMLEGTASDDG